MGERIALRRCQRVLVAGMRQSFRKSAVCGQAGFGGGEGGAGIIGKERRRGLRFLQMVIEGENVLARFYHAFFKQIAIIGAQIIAVSSPIKGNCIKKIAAIYAIFFPVIMKYFLIGVWDKKGAVLDNLVSIGQKRSYSSSGREK